MMLADTQPLVSCIMPTYKRRAFVPQAIYYFLRQDYPNKELIIVDDSTDEVGDLVPGDERIRYIRSPGRQSIGLKRNLACAEARGPIIAHWDDDDWYAPHRLRYQVEALLREGADACGIATVLFYEILTGAAWKYTFPIKRRPWLYGSTLCYRNRSAKAPVIDPGDEAPFLVCEVRGAHRAA